MQYAHQRLVVHRDIKPGNILVTDDGIPKLLDFGIATILPPETYSSAAYPTVSAARIMTPQFASPSSFADKASPPQPTFTPWELSLYELMTGHPPYRLDKTSSAYDLVRVICETEPEKPSIAVERPGEINDHRHEGSKATPDTSVPAEAPLLTSCGERYLVISIKSC